MSRVLIVAPVYEYEPILAPSLRAQTHQDWQLLLIHDGPNQSGIETELRRWADERIRFYESDQRYNDWGHSLRAAALELIDREPIAGDFILITNGDNYYVPGCLEQLLAAFDEEAVAVCCWAVHSHHQWALMETQLQFTRVDCGCVLVRREAALAVGWTSREFAADWEYVRALAQRYGETRFRIIPKPLFVHN